MKMPESSPNGRKNTMGNEKLLGMTNGVLKRFVPQTSENLDLCGNGLSLYQTIPNLNVHAVNEHFLVSKQSY